MFGKDLTPNHAEAIADLVEDIELRPISLFLSGFGAFPPRGLPRVVWAGLGGDTGFVTELQQELTEIAEPYGIEREKRGFTPHITLGRVQGQFGLLALIDQMKKPSWIRAERRRYGMALPSSTISAIANPATTKGMTNIATMLTYQST